MTTIQLAREMLKAGMSLERVAAALGVKSALLDLQLWRAVAHDEASELRACRALDTAKQDWS